MCQIFIDRVIFHFPCPFSFKAEIDSAAELIDFIRFNSYFGKEVMKYQPISEKPEVTLNLVNINMENIRK
jgi:hypothetical protein